MYEAIICSIHTRPHPNADKLLLGEAHGYQVVVGLDTKDGELGVFFPTDGQLSEEMCEANDLIGYTDPVTGEKRGGYFPRNRRVRSQKFRGERSDGYWTPLTSLVWTGAKLDKLTEGTKFTELNGKPVCNKYFTPATLKAMARGGPARQNNFFAKHVETDQFKNEVDRIPINSIIYITEKLHGTSGRFGNVLDQSVEKRTLLDRLFRRTRISQSYTELIGTRNTILGKHSGPSFYGSEEFRYEAIRGLEGRLHPGEILYFEIVGYTHTGASIMGQHDVTKLQDKTLQKKYGKVMEYRYGCNPETTPFKLFVYRITQVAEDGHTIELSWPQVKARCAILGLQHVPEIPVPPHVWGWSSGDILKAVEHHMEGESTLDHSHIREGVVLRVEQPNGETKFLKAKSFTFGLLEGYIKERDDYIDTEEVA